MVKLEFWPDTDHPGKNIWSIGPRSINQNNRGDRSKSVELDPVHKRSHQVMHIFSSFSLICSQKRLLVFQFHSNVNLLISLKALLFKRCICLHPRAGQQKSCNCCIFHSKSNDRDKQSRHPALRVATRSGKCDSGSVDPKFIIP